MISGFCFLPGSCQVFEGFSQDRLIILTRLVVDNTILLLVQKINNFIFVIDEHSYEK